jgi:hypothetical protein
MIELRFKRSFFSLVVAAMLTCVRDIAVRLRRNPLRCPKSFAPRRRRPPPDAVAQRRPSKRFHFRSRRKWSSSRFRSGRDLWTRIRRGYAIPDLVDDPLVAKWEEWYSSRPDYVARMIDRSRRYLYYIVVEVEQRHMPLEIALLPMVESAYNPNACRSPAHPGSGSSCRRRHALRAQAELLVRFAPRRRRRDREARSTTCRSSTDFSDWQLALAAYNWGEGNVAKSLAKNQGQSLPATTRASACRDERATTCRNCRQ